MTEAKTQKLAENGGQPPRGKKGAGKPRKPGPIAWTDLTDPSKAGTTRDKVARSAKDGTQRGITAHKGSPKITEDLLVQFETFLVKGLPVDTACRLVGIWPSAMQQRCEKDPDLSERIERARAKAQLEVFESHKDLAYQGARTGGTEFLLGRLWPKQFAPPTKTLETTGKDGGPIQTEAKQLVTYEFPKNSIVGTDD